MAAATTDYNMAKYESGIKMIPQATAEQVYRALGNLETFRPILDNAANDPMVKQKLEEAGQDPANLEKLKDIELTNDTIAFPVPMIGKLTLQIVEREENKCVKFQAADAPLDANLWIQVLPVSAGGAKMKVTLKAELNMMMKMMIGSKLEQGVDKMADMLATLPYQMM